MTYNIFLDYDDDTFNIVKTPTRKPVQVIEGKYGIEFHTDINGQVVKIVIPEPDVLFGVNMKYIESFLIMNLN